MKPTYRHELKYLISERERDIIKARLSEFARTDPHAEGGSYFIRSLYFDDLWHSAYEEKLSGVSMRKKYRIRSYNMDRSFICLECKRKQGNYIFKTQQRISGEELYDILNGEYGKIKGNEGALMQEFYISCISEGLRPHVIVDYERTPFIFEAGTVRITFDEHVRAGFTGYDIFDGGIPVFEALEPDKLILEVKYTEFLPEIFRSIIPPNAALLTAVSKYVLCLDTKSRIRGF